MTHSFTWRDDDGDHDLRLVQVRGTDGTPFLFGGAPVRPTIEIRDFHIATTLVTQALWSRVMGANPARRVEARAPVENVSWDQITGAGGFLERINASEIVTAIAGSDRSLRFRLPSETEWEYAARGGSRWRDDFAFSGSNDPDAVAWYGPRWGPALGLATALFGWRIGWRFFGRLRVIATRPRRTHAVAMKAPNQLGVYDMSGNVWEWCQDTCTDDIDAVPRDGTPWLGASDERRVRGGSHHNWDLHCRVWWRYGITPEDQDGSIGFRLVLS